MLNIAVVDDEPYICEILSKEISKLLLLEDIEYRTWLFTSAVQLLASTQSAFDIILFDIELPSLNGIEASKILRNENNQAIIIYITSKMNYMEQAFGLNVFAFLDKKDIPNTFAKVLCQCLEYIEQNIMVMFKTNYGLLKIRKENIIYAAFENRKVTVYTIKGCFKVNLTSLHQFDNIIKSKNFIYINRSTIINLSFLVSIVNKNAFLDVLNISIPISKDRYHDVQLCLINWISSKGG